MYIVVSYVRPARKRNSLANDTSLALYGFQARLEIILQLDLDALMGEHNYERWKPDQDAWKNQDVQD